MKLNYYRRKGIIIAKNREVSPYAYLDCHRPNKKIRLLKLGENVRVSRGVMVLVSDKVDKMNMEKPWKDRKHSYATTTIGNNVFIGAMSIILLDQRLGIM